MRSGLEIIIHAEGYTLYHPASAEAVEYVRRRDIDLGARVAEFCMQHKVNVARITLYIDDELLFLKSFTLPLATPAIKDAIKFQLSMMVPFAAEEMIYSTAIKRGKKDYHINLCAAQDHVLGKSAQELTRAGYQLTGLFPESQRYVTTTKRKKRWALVMPCQFTKVYVFAGQHLADRFLSNTELDYGELVDICQTDDIYHLAAPAGSEYKDAEALLAGNPALKEHNMLPESFRRPDYLRYVIILLLAVNVVGLLALGGVKAYQLSALSSRVDEEIVAVMPQVREAKRLRLQENKISKHVKAVNDLGANPDLVGFLTELTQILPEDSYLDQLRYDAKNKVIVLQGYTGNIGELTKQLQGLGETRLKSTSRRRNKTYFQVEISLS